MPGNDTYSSSSYGIVSTPFTLSTMPLDQKAKLLAMHKAGRANAGIYVAVVLAVYICLLTLLLCRYARRYRPTDSSTLPPLSSYPSPPPPTNGNTGLQSYVSRFKFFLCGGQDGVDGFFYQLKCCIPVENAPEDENNIDEDEPVNFPLTPLAQVAGSSSPKGSTSRNSLSPDTANVKIGIESCTITPVHAQPKRTSV